MHKTTYEQEVDLKDLIFAILYKWKIIIVTANRFCNPPWWRKGHPYIQKSERPFLHRRNGTGLSGGTGTVRS